MNTKHSPEEEKKLIEKHLGDIRTVLAPYFVERNLILSNEQVLNFLLLVPAAMAIASDGLVDAKEKVFLEILPSVAARFPEMPEELSHVSQPDNCLSDVAFKERLGPELTFLSYNMQKYEDALVKAVSTLLEFGELMPDHEDDDHSPRTDLEVAISGIMRQIIMNNLGDDVVERNKIDVLLQKIGVKNSSFDF